MSNQQINPKLVEAIGYFGSLLSCITFIPQVYLTWQTKNVESLSLLMILIVNFSCIVWLTYAYLIKSKPVLVANTIVLTLSLMLLYFKLTFQRIPFLALNSKRTIFDFKISYSRFNKKRGHEIVSSFFIKSRIMYLKIENGSL